MTPKVRGLSAPRDCRRVPRRRYVVHPYFVVVEQCIQSQSETILPNCRPMMKTAVAAAASAAALYGIPRANAFTQPSVSVAARFAHERARTTVRPRVSMSTISAPPVITSHPGTSSISIDMEDVRLSGLNGLALKDKKFPTKREVINVIPKHCFVKDTIRSMKYAVLSCSMTLLLGSVAAIFFPVKVRNGWIWLHRWKRKWILCVCVCMCSCEQNVTASQSAMQWYVSCWCYSSRAGDGHNTYGDHANSIACPLTPRTFTRNVKFMPVGICAVHFDHVCKNNALLAWVDSYIRTLETWTACAWFYLCCWRWWAIRTAGKYR